MSIDKIQENLKYYTLLSEKYPTIQEAATEIINLQAILNLPKGTEHFMSDLHGEYESFLHILKNGSGVIRRKIDDIFKNTITDAERKKLASLIYYPEQKLELLKEDADNLKDFYKITLYRLIEVCRVIASKYTRSKVRKAMPKDFAYILEELLQNNDQYSNKDDYYEQIIDSIIELERADAFIIALSRLIQHLAVDRLHIIGDVFDRGPGADIIMDALMNYHSVDIQWGNHDILWMGAAAGSLACIANVIGIAARYNNLDTLEEGYGISLRQLSTFANEMYRKEECERFLPKNLEHIECNEKDMTLISKMYKAIIMIQFKLEGQIIKRNPQFDMDKRLLLDKIDYENLTVKVGSKTYPLIDCHFPTVDPKNPYELTDEEQDIMNKLKLSFKHNARLQRHISFLYKAGSMYKTFNGNLLYHGCIPLNEDGSFHEKECDGQKLSGKALMDYAEMKARQGYFASPGTAEKQSGEDFLWYLWCGYRSPLYGKDKNGLFERSFVADKAAAAEIKDPYYQYIEDEETCVKILHHFGLSADSEAHIINGHVPVKIKKGESPLKAGGRLMVIDGGLSKAYQSQTGIAGYTLIYNSYGMLLVAHQPFVSVQEAITKEIDIHSSFMVVEKVVDRKKVKDTDTGTELRKKIIELKLLLKAYQNGIIRENGRNA